MIFNIFFEIEKNFSDKIKKFFSEEDFQKIFSEIQKFLPDEKKKFEITNFGQNNLADGFRFPPSREGQDSKEINLFFISDDEIKNLNNKFRNKNSATDCLSFEKDEQDDFDPVFGECFIAMPYIQNQAEEYGVSLRFEVAKMIIHSVLHLYGYDHIEDKDFEKMNFLEEKIMGSLKKYDFC